ncbi:MAG: hypothetical protein WCP10_05265 [Desulfuromonadales bacterium]
MKKVFLSLAYVFLLAFLFLAAPSNSWSTCATTSTLINYGYIGGCDYTASTTFTLAQSSDITNIRVWYNTKDGGNTLPTTLTGPNGYSNSVTLSKSSSCQGSWCEANWALGQILPAGSYTLTTASKSMCYDPSGKTTLGITGCAASSSTSSTTAATTTATTPVKVTMTTEPRVYLSAHRHLLSSI